MRHTRAALLAAGALVLACTDQLVTVPHSGKDPGRVAAPVTSPAVTDNSIFSDGFESGDLSAWQDGVDATTQHVLTDSTRAHSGSHVLQLTYPSGQGAGWLTRFFMPGYDSAYVSYWVRLDSTWSGSTALLTLRGSRTDNQWSAFGKSSVCPSGSDFFAAGVVAGTATNALDLAFATYYTGMTQCSAQSQGIGTTNYATTRRLTPGPWHRIESWVKLNTVGQSDGVQRVWLDGQLAGEWTGLVLRTNEVLRLNSLMLDGFATAPQTQHLYIDDVNVLPAMPSATPAPPAPVAAVSTTLNTPNLTVGQSTQAVATLKDAGGNVLTGRVTSWTSSNTGVATVDSTGLVKAVTVGSASITATAEGINGSATVTVTPVPVAAVSVTLNSPSLTVGQSTQAVSKLTDASGAVLTGRAVSWSSSNTSVASVDATGLVKALAAGNATITATSGGVSGSAPLTVVAAPPPPVDNAIFSEGFESGTLAAWQDGVNASTQHVLTDATLAHSGTHVLQLQYPAGQGAGWLTRFFMPGYDSLYVSYWIRLDPAWTGSTALLGLRGSRTDNQWSAFGKSSTCPNGTDFFATIISAGAATNPLDLTFASYYPGMSACTGQSQGLGTTTYASARRLTPGGWHQIAVWLKLNTVGQANGQQDLWLDGTLVGQWTGLSYRTSTILRLNSLMVDAFAAAPQAEQAYVDDISVLPALPAGVTLPGTPPPPTPAPVATVGVTLNAPSLTVGQSTQAAAVTKDASGNVLTGRTITWSSANTAVATVDGNGLVHAVAAGTVNIIATSEGISGSASLTVSSAAPPPPAPVVSVSVSLQSSSVAVGGTSQATATLRDSSGNALSGRTVTWSSSNTLVGTVSSSGVVTGVAPGTATITATSEGQSGSASITVTLVPVASVAVTLTPSGVAVGQTAQAAAVLKDAQGNPLTGRTVTWSSSNAAVATVSSSGAVQAVAAGTATITATVTGVTGSATLTVTQVPVASTTVTLNSPSLTGGQNTQASAVTKDASGNVLTGRAISWSSSNTAVATVSGSGLVQAVAAGTASISATSEGKTGSATLTVTLAPVATVTLSPASVSLPVSATQQMTAATKDASGNTLSGRAITWASNATGVATVSSTGMVTAVAAGSATITATSEGKSGMAGVTVTTAVSPGAGVPVYDPSNPDHVLHVLEDWSAYNSASDVGVKNRADGGGPWLNGNAGSQTISTNNVDPWFGKKTLDLNYQAAPAANSAFEHGVTLIQGTPARYLNASSAKDAIVLEWAWRWEGGPYEGKIADFQPYAGTDRFNYQTDPDNLGAQQQTSCDADPLCSKYYTNNGNTPRFAGLTPSANYGTGAIARSMYAQNPIFYRQNRNWAPNGNGTGSVDWGGNSWQTIGITFADNRWRRTILRLTMNLNGVMGQGRIEEWMQIAGQPAVKVMEYIGDPSGFDAGLVKGRDVSQGGSTWISTSATLYLYNLSAVGGIFNGGNTTHVGYVRIWSESRQ